MTSDDQLPPRPAKVNKPSFKPEAGVLPPMGYEHSDHDSQGGQRFHWLTGFYGLTPAMTTGAIFAGSFILAVLFTSMILAGIIEVQPSVIKGFFKSLLGKS